MNAKEYINLEVPTILGMGAVGPTLAVLTASLYQALASSVESPPAWAYPAIMFVLAGLLAVFPVAKAKYPQWQRLILWPLAAVVIFSAAWGTNSGLSKGEEVLDGTAWIPTSFPSLVGSCYAGTDDVVEGPVTNAVDFAKLDMATKKACPKGMFENLPKNVWGLSWPVKGTAILKDADGKWWHYSEKKPEVRPPSPPPKKEPVQQHPLKGGFFKRF